MYTTKETFTSLCTELSYRYDERTVFDDFLTMSICSFSPNPTTGKSYDEDLYLQTVAKYKDDPKRFNLPKMLACLTTEMEERLLNGDSTDILGEFYESQLYRKGTSQYFTPWPICQFMAKSTCNEAKKQESDQPLRILDPACGSGRMLIASAMTCGRHHHFYGIDIDTTCVKMTALNLFLNGVFYGEVMCANALMPDDFRESYRLSFLPFGIFRITEKEKSPLWHLHRSSFNKKQEEQTKPLVLPSEERKVGERPPEGSQLTLL